MIDNHKGAVWDLDPSWDAKYLLTACGDGNARLFETTTGKYLVKMPHKGYVILSVCAFIYIFHFTLFLILFLLYMHVLYCIVFLNNQRCSSSQLERRHEYVRHCLRPLQVRRSGPGVCVWIPHRGCTFFSHRYVSVYAATTCPKINIFTITSPY